VNSGQQKQTRFINILSMFATNTKHLRIGWWIWNRIFSNEL